jgi:YegS/Rv2252/BmrU family lipid kinase
MAAHVSPTVEILVSSRSRRGERDFERCLDELRLLGVPVGAALKVTGAADFRTALRGHVQARSKVVAVGGGDGTLRLAAEELAGTDTALAVLPLGTGNSFSRDLGIGNDIAKACRVIAEGRADRLDVGRANGRAFLNVATVGLSTQIALGLDPTAKRRLGVLAYLAPGLMAVWAARPFKVWIDLPEGSREADALQVVVGNGRRHAGPFLVTERAGLKTGRLHGYVLAARDKAGLFRFVRALVRGDHESLGNVVSFDAPALTVATEPRKRVTIDGDVTERTPVRFEVAAGSLLTLVPRDFETMDG